jgi:ribosome-binding protein aMBF1 (putative translation factor)
MILKDQRETKGVVMSESKKPEVQAKPVTTFPELVRVYRRFRGMTQVELAEKMGIAESAVQAYEAGQSCPRPENAPKLFRILGCDRMEGAKLLDAWEQQQGRQRKAAERRQKRLEETITHRLRARASARKRKQAA